jgi:hypothetical protein
MPTLEIEIGTGSDDGYGFYAGYELFNNDEDTAFFGDDGASSHCFLRFILPSDELKGVVITSALLNLWMPGAGGQAEVNIYADSRNDPDAPQNWPDLDGIPYTTAFVPFITIDIPDGIQQTPDISAVIQELVDNNNMNSGDAVMVILDGDAYGVTNAREIATWESFNPQAQLVIEYEAGAVVPFLEQTNTGGDIGGSTSGDVTLTNPPKLGSLLVCTFGSGQAQAQPAMLPTWEVARNEGDRLVIYYKFADASDVADPSWPWSFGSPDQLAWVAGEYSNQGGWPSLGSVVLDTDSTNDGTTGSPTNSGTVTPGVPNVLLFAGFNLRNVTPANEAVDNGFTIEDSSHFGGSSNVNEYFVDRIEQAASGDYTVDLSWEGGDSSFTRGMIVAFEYIPGSVGPTTITSVWDGANWVPVATSVWDGANWVPVATSVWDGNAWVP